MLRDALRQTRKVGLGQLSVRGREQLVSLKPCGRGLVLEVLRYGDEVNKAQTYFRGMPAETADEDMLDLATSIIDKRTAPFKPEEFHDRYVDALHRLIDKKKKAKGKRIIEEVDDQPSGRSGSNVIDLMAALKKSAGETARKSAAKKTGGATKAPTAAKRTATTRRKRA